MKRLLSLLLFAFIFFGLAHPALALTKTGERIVIPKNQTVNETLYASGESIEIQGTVNGDILCAGNSIKVTGKVNGDLLCAGQSITVDGLINGNIRSAGEQLNLNGQVTRNVMFFGQNLIQNSQSIVDGEMFLGGQNAQLDGTVKQKITGGIDNIVLNGSIGSTDISGTSVTVGPEASISGNLKYSSSTAANISPNAAISGAVTQNPPQVNSEHFKEAFETFGLVLYVIWKVTLFILLLVAAILVALLFPRFSQEIMTTMQKDALHSLLWGLLFSVTGIFLIGLLVVTLIGIPLALFGIFLFCLSMFVARIFVAIFVGDFLMTKLRSKSKTPLVLSTIVGVILTWIVFQIPVVGALISMVASVWALGAIIITSRNKHHSW